MTVSLSERRIGIILAGGIGERFWPLSRMNRPKQLLHLTDPSKSMLQHAVDHLEPVIPRDRIYISTSAGLVDLIRAAETGVPPENVIGEPCKRNTAGALAYVTAHIIAGHPEIALESLTTAVVTADHYIGDALAFQRALRTALEAAEQHDTLVVFGIPPAHPETGFGYIEVAAGAGALPGGDAERPVYPVAGFREKPDLETARMYLASGRHYWNSGMFFWRVTTFLAELDLAQPAMAQTIRAMADALRAGQPRDAAALFGQLPDLSIDYALMEHARRVLMVRGSFPWQDVGSWAALDPLLPRDERGNVAHGAPVIVDSSGCVVFNEAGPDRMAVGVLGMDNVAVVVTDDAVLVVSKKRAQEVRRIVEELRRRNAPQR